MGKRFLAGLSAVVLAVAAVPMVKATPIGAGDLVVIRVGDGATTASGTALPVTLDDYVVTYTAGVPTGVALQQSVALPSSGTVPTTGNRNLVQGGTAGGEGGLTLSADGTQMALAGYNTSPGSAVNSGATTLEDRVVGLLNLSTGTVDTTTAFAGWSGSTQGGTAARGAYVDGSNVWLAASTGTRYGTTLTTIGSTGVSVGTTNNARRVVVYNGQLYQSEAANSRSGIETVGTAEPTTAGGAVSLLPGFGTASGTYSDYDFWFANSTTAYIADDGNTTTASGLQKWTFNGTTWSMVYDHKITSINPGGSSAAAGIKSLTGYIDASGNAIIFGSTTGANANDLLGFFDPAGNTTALGLTENVIASGATDFNFRGVSLAPVPEPTSLALIGGLAVPLITRRRRRA